MAIGRTDTFSAADLIPGAGDTPVSVQTVIRLQGIEWPDESHMNLTYEIRMGDHRRRHVIPIGPDPVPADPPEDEINQKTGEVIVSAGAYAARIPSLTELRALPIPQQLMIPDNVGDLYDLSRQAFYLLTQRLNAAWAGEEV